MDQKERDRQRTAQIDAEGAAQRKFGLYTLSWVADVYLEKAKIKAVTLRKYCDQGRFGVKIGKTWLLTMAEIKAIDKLPPETRRPGRPKGSKNKA